MMYSPYTIKLIALRAYSMPATGQKALKNSLMHQWVRFVRRLPLRLASLLFAPLLLAACATPQPPAPKAIYDFGAVLSAQAAATAVRSQTIALPEIEAGGSLDSPALLYRLQYSNAQQLLPYAGARWSVPPAQLVRARLRDALARQGPVLTAEGIAPWVLRVELDEFSHVFDSPDKSFGLVRLRASLLKNDQLTAQTSLLARAVAPSQNAAGGVNALTAATDDAVSQLASWVATQIK